MVGRRAEGVSVTRTKWWWGAGSSRFLRRALAAAGLRASAFKMTKKRSVVSVVLVRAVKSRTMSMEILSVLSSGVRKRARER